MSAPSPERNEQLFQAYLDRRASAAEAAELAQALRDDPAAADAFARATRFEALLETHLLEQVPSEQRQRLPGEIFPRDVLPGKVETAPVRSIAAGTRGRILSWGLAAAAAAVVVGATMYFLPPGRDEQPGEVAAAHRVVAGRVLVDGVEASTVPDGARVEVLGQTAASIRLTDGCYVQLAPSSAARFLADAAGPIVALDYGNGTFRNPDARRSIRVDTLAGDISGRDAEFSVECQSTAEPGDISMGPKLFALLTVAVLTGQVEVQEADSRDSAVQEPAAKEPGAKEPGEKGPLSKSTDPRPAASASPQKTKLSAGERRAFSAEKKPTFAGRVIEVAADGMRITLEGKPPKPGAPPQRREVRITPETQLTYYGVPRGADRPSVGAMAVAALDPQAPDRGTVIEFGEKQPKFSGIVRGVSDEGRTLTIEVFHKNEKSTERTFRIDDATRVSYRGVESTGEKPTIGYLAAVWPVGDSDRAAEVVFAFKLKGVALPKSSETAPGSPLKKSAPEKKPEKQPEKKSDAPTQAKSTVKPATDGPQKEKKPVSKPAPSPPKEAKPVLPKRVPTKAGEPKKAAELKQINPEKRAPALPGSTPGSTSSVNGIPHRAATRDPLPAAAAIDREIERLLADKKIPASPPADDAEFLRRAQLDITGRIPSYGAARAFLESTDPDKRRKLIDALLTDPAYGVRFGAVWRRLIQPRPASNAKPQVDRFTPWLAEQLNAGRGWNEVVVELLTTEADLARAPQGYFLAVNSQSFDPQPNLLAASTARLFLGVQLGCAECHNHPFAEWKQTEFWNLAAFFSRVHKRSKSDYSLTEDMAQPPAAAEITVPAGGQSAGSIVPARFLGGGEPNLRSAAPLRSVLAEWITADDNPYFARVAVNRLWGHLFGRGLVEPLDGFGPAAVASHPAVLDLLAAEFTASGYDVRHILRVVCNTRAYGRTSRPLPENEVDDVLRSHMAIKVLPADLLYDSLAMALNGNFSAPVPPQANAKNTKNVQQAKSGDVFSGGSFSVGPRDEFVNFFSATAGEAGPQDYSHGIPQLLRLMNSEPLNAGSPTAKSIAAAAGPPEEKIAALYLATLSRRPSEDETATLVEYVTGRPTAEEAYAGVLWILLNSSEFVLNR